MTIVRTDYYVEHDRAGHLGEFADADTHNRQRHLHVLHGCQQYTSATPDELVRWHRADHDERVTS